MTKINASILKNRKCCKCGSSDTYIKNTGSPDWHGCECKKEDCLGYICYECFKEVKRLKTEAIQNIRLEERKCHICGGNEIKDHWRFDKNGPLCSKCQHKTRYDATMGSVVNCRTGMMRIDSNHGKGLIGEAVVAKVRNINVISIEKDNFKDRFDLSIDKEYGMIQVKLRILYDTDWRVSIGIDEDFDHLLIVCICKGGHNVERVYIIPKNELLEYLGIRICGKRSKWETFRVSNIDNYREAYRSLMSFIGNKKYFSSDDIRKWLDGSGGEQ